LISIVTSSFGPVHSLLIVKLGEEVLTDIYLRRIVNNDFLTLSLILLADGSLLHGNLTKVFKKLIRIRLEGVLGQEISTSVSNRLRLKVKIIFSSDVSEAGESGFGR
jgi:hypothetical protein